MAVGLPQLDAVDAVEISWDLPAGFWKGLSVLGAILAMGVFTYGEKAGKTLFERGDGLFLKFRGGFGFNSC